MKARAVKINSNVIRCLNPCDDRFNNWVEHYKSWSGNILEFLELDLITPRDKIWVAVRVLPRLIVETFALDCAFSANQYAAYNAAYNAADAAYNAAYNAAAYDAYAAADAAYAAAYGAYAAAYGAYAAYNAADAERENQIDALICLINHEDKL